ncbi:matrix metalloproteinase-C-like [Hydractinia symbiolongicarpus]|uniref:matrix metalloproteinase-C-like n=1 Tax=Hydractinia symbiolongicarpus TaxID=13093 RepID=UPI00254F1987|nr:matrix metalloproteinase-C-like [Hydractinia symbiolongicarpus]
MAIFKVVFVVALVAIFDVKGDDAKDYLTKYGYYNPFAFDGGDGMATAIKQFQTFHQLPVTGVLDTATKDEMSKPRCGMSDVVSTNAYFATRGKWRTTQLTYYFENTGRDLAMNVVKNEIKKAFDMWAAVTPLTFREVSSRGHINIGWYVGNHGDNGPFERRRGGVLAHAYFPENGRLHFDEYEDWAVNGNRGTDLLWVAVHEIGHALGLQHSRVSGTIMWPTYYGYKAGLKLHQDDISGIQSLYGRGTGGTGTGGTGTGGGNCNNNHNRCEEWANRGECRINPRWMLVNCKKSCRQC